MDTEDLKKRLNDIIDIWAGENGLNVVGGTLAKLPDESEVTSEPARVLPEGKRVVRTKSSGDRVYVLDDDKKTRQWITNPDVLKGIGFEIEDVEEVEDNELLKYQMGPAIHRVDS